MTITIGGTIVDSISVDGTSVNTVVVDGTRVWPDTYVIMTAGTVNISGSTDAFGYSDGTALGTFGSISQDTTHKGNTIHTIYWDEINANRFRFTLDGTHTQNSQFDRIEVETESSGTQVFRPEDADIFTQSGGYTNWFWNFATQMFVDTNKYRVWIFNQ